MLEEGSVTSGGLTNAISHLLGQTAIRYLQRFHMKLGVEDSLQHVNEGIVLNKIILLADAPSVSTECSAHDCKLF